MQTHFVYLFRRCMNQPELHRELCKGTLYPNQCYLIQNHAAIKLASRLFSLTDICCSLHCMGFLSTTQRTAMQNLLVQAQIGPGWLGTGNSCSTTMGMTACIMHLRLLESLSMKPACGTLHPVGFCSRVTAASC